MTSKDSNYWKIRAIKAEIDLDLERVRHSQPNIEKLGGDPTILDVEEKILKKYRRMLYE